MKRHLAVTAAALSLVAALPAAAPAAGLKRGVYDCKGTASGYVNSVRILSGGRYVVGSSRVDGKLKDTTKGRFRVKGKTIRWLSGMYKRGSYRSTIYDGYFSIDRARDNIWTGISCYHLPRPNGVAAPGVG